MVLYSCCLLYLTDIDAINDGQSMCNRHEVLRLANAVVPSPYQSTYSYSSQNSKLCKSDKFIHFYIVVVSLFFDIYIYIYMASNAVFI